MPQPLNSESASPEEIHAFLSVVGNTNESTEYSKDQEYIVNAIIDLARAKGRKTIVDDFETPYIHPLVTIQKWIDELKLIADEALNERIYGERHSLFKKKIVEMDGYDLTRFITYLKDDGYL